MFPIPFNFPFRKKDGSVTSIGAAIDAGGGGGYELPTASANTKGGVKIGSRLTMTGEVLSADLQLPAHTIAEAGKVLTVGNDGSLEWDENGGAGVEVLTQSEWDEMTTAEKQAKGTVAIQDATTGYYLGYLVNATNYVNNPFKVHQTYDTTGDIICRDLGDEEGCEIIYNGISNHNGLVLEVTDPTVTSFLLTYETKTAGGQLQHGYCTKAATLPTIVSEGAGRISYAIDVIHGYTNFDPTNNNFFIASQTVGTYSFTAKIVAVRE